MEWAAVSRCLSSLPSSVHGGRTSLVVAWNLRFQALETLVRVDPLAGARPKAYFSASEQAQVGSVLGFFVWSEHFFPESYFQVGNATAQSWFRSAYTLNVAAFSSLLSFFQRSDLCGGRLKSSSAPICGVELFGFSQFLRPGRKGVR